MSTKPGREGAASLRVAMALGGAAAAIAAGTGHLAAARAAFDGGAVSRVQDPAQRPETFEWLAPSVRVGRNELQIARFRAERSPGDLLDSMTAHWAQRGSPVQRTTEGGWLIAIQADGEWVETVRIRADEGGAAGLRIRQRLVPATGAPRGVAIERLLPRARVVNRSEQEGDGRVITTWVLVSRSDPGMLLASARSEARREGFAEDPARARAGGALWLRRRGEEVVINATPGLDGSVAVVHWSRKP